MALLRKTDPVGLDLRIDQFQRPQFVALGFTEDQYQSYPRVYMNEKVIDGKRGHIPEYFTSAGNDYEDVMFNDNYDLSSFFYQHTRTEYDKQTGTVRVSQIIQAQLDRLFGDVPHRFDEELKGMFEDYAIRKFPSRDQFKLVDTFTTIEEVYRDFLTEHIEHDDMHPFYVVRLEYLVRYNPNQQC
jgi:hypothetical protein